MTGAYLRVKRNNKYEAIEVEHLTGRERMEIIGTRPVPEIMKWFDMVCNKLVEIEPLLDSLEKDGIIKR